MATRKDQELVRTAPFEAVIGLEVHVQLATRTKMFCRCEARFGEEPNNLTCPVCVGMPGALPYINRQAIDHAVRVGVAFDGAIPRRTKFDRKNYFYPDLPKGYQISQHDEPICGGGRIEYALDGEPKVVRLVRVHLEEDAGKNIHVEGRPESWVDLNRAGTPLLEIVTEPDLHSPEEAGAFLRMLRQVMLYLEVSDCNMEQGSLRCDCNVSIRPCGSDHLETRAEIKNLNSFANVESALTFEIARQIRVRQAGGTIDQETRLYDPERDETRSMRGKEEAHDYRYFPEPDLAPLTFDPAWVDAVRAGLPELPMARRARLLESSDLTEYQVDLLVRDRDQADFFESALAIHAAPKSIANWIINALQEEMRARRCDISALGLSPERFVDLVRAVDDGKVSSQKGREVLAVLLDRPDAGVVDLIGELGLEQISDDSFIRDVVDKVIAAHPGPVADVRKGKKQSINFLVGQVMRESKGKANPGKAAELLRMRIGELGEE